MCGVVKRVKNGEAQMNRGGCGGVLQAAGW